MVAGTVLVTGASGFVGLALVPQLRSAGYRVIAATRNPDKFEGLEAVRLPSPAEPAEAFAHIVANVDHVVHLAAIAHTQLAGAAATYHAVNCELAAKLAEAAHRTIAGKFVFVSSIRAQCGSVHSGVAVESDPPQPTDDYGRAKLAAEAEIASIMTRGNYTILRPVLVYGAGVKGNMAALSKLASLRAALPLKSLDARRSLLDRASLCAAIIHSLRETGTDAGTFIVADKSPVTVPQIITAIRRGLGRKPGLFSCPTWVLAAAARLTGQGARWQTMNGDLIASSAMLQSTGWSAVENSARRIEDLSRH